ncbi:restriction endonuclease [Lacticaseibacillus baoqingensis]|uniref:Restriction endonuclease n=1 Tax=Lacticaseibacillus baoqingensis TaxID=2486013 RepID=A0ABW4E4B6_9LACO|nr:restriction endonuclease [Lacticaseibacillus baoqingensis]
MFHRLLMRAYWLLTGGFVLALVYSFFARQFCDANFKSVLDPAAFGFISVWVVVNAIWVYRHHFQYRDLQMESVDAMEGEEFEHFCGYLLRRNGYKHIRVTQASGDQGIDIIASKQGKTYGFQCKRYTGFVGNKAVQEVWTGHNFYKLDEATVLTNSEFSDSARELADDLGVHLIDRTRLRRMMRRLPS